MKAKKILLFIIILLLVVVGAIAVIYFKTDIFNHFANSSTLLSLITLTLIWPG